MSKRNKNQHKIKEYRNAKLQARLSFNEGYAEHPIYSIKAFTSEKEKGFNMAKLILDNFGFSIIDLEDHLDKKDKEMVKDMKDLANGKKDPKDGWTRDERGNLVSPWSVNAVKK